MSIEAFKTAINTSYTFKHDSIIVGTGMYQQEGVPDAHIKIPLKTLNRHGLVAGATGTGKTKTLQVIAEQLSLKGIPSLLMDMKGDLSGIAQPGVLNKHITKRHNTINLDYHPQGLPVEFLTLSKSYGSQLKATITEFGPLLISKILDLNGTQSGIVSLIFQYCENENIPLLDIKDLKKVLQYSIDEGKDELAKEYGRISSASVNTILRKLIEIEQQDADLFFGETSFDTQDLIRQENGEGVISILRLDDIQDKPQLFSTFMLGLLSEIYKTFPEQGDKDQPELVIFIDEAHLIFKDASKALIDKIESIVKLIRSKGIGLFFVTQNPSDLPDAVLSQLGLKVQHSLRAFTAKDRKDIKQTAQNYPNSEFYEVDEILTQMGIGEALVTALNEKGVPTELSHTLLRAPVSRMGVLTQSEIKEVVKHSKIATKYNTEVDRESAYEILTKKIERSQQITEKETPKKNTQKRKTSAPKEEPGMVETLSKNTMIRQIGRTIFRELTKGILRALKK